MDVLWGREKILSLVSNPLMRHHAPVHSLKSMLTQMALTDLHESQNKQKEQKCFLNMGKRHAGSSVFKGHGTHTEWIESKEKVIYTCMQSSKYNFNEMRTICVYIITQQERS